MAYLGAGMPQLEFTITTFMGLLGSLVLGAAYAAALYSSSTVLSGFLRKTLFGVRVLLVALLAFLLFAPLLKSTQKSLEKPLIILAQDNSASIGISRTKNFNPQQYSRAFRALEKVLANDYEVMTMNFGSGAANGLAFDFDQKLTNISSVFELIRDRFSNRNIGAVVLATDGIYTRGGNPQYDSRDLNAPVYTIALGDTVPKKDLLVSNVNYNNLAYLGNKFQIEVNLEAFQSRGSSAKLTVRDRTGPVFTKTLEINSQEFRQTIPVTLLAGAKGVQKYTVSVAPVQGELSRVNNSQTIYVEVIDGKQNILILAHAPHPDISSIKQAIEQNENYQVKVRLADEVEPEEIAKSGLIILHQIPAVNDSHQEILRQIGDKPVFYILGSQTNTSLFSSSQPAIIISSSTGTQEAHARVKADFYAFTLSEATTQRLADFAPLLTPFGNYAMKAPMSVLLSQQIGNVQSQAPLLAFADVGNRKIGVLAGEGIWRWRLEDFQESGNHDAVDELIGKSVQYLSSRDDKRKFRVYTSRSTFDENERVILNAELYNDAFELVNTPDVDLSLKSLSGKKYSYNFSRSGNSYILDAGILPAGEYVYDAHVSLGSKRHSATGRFIVVQQQVEFQQTTANHQLLYSMAKQSGGQMLMPSELGELPRLIKANENIKTVSYENRLYEEMIDKKWVFFLLLALLCLEWFTRKRNGEI